MDAPATTVAASTTRSNGRSVKNRVLEFWTLGHQPPPSSLAPLAPTRWRHRRTSQERVANLFDAGKRGSTGGGRNGGRGEPGILGGKGWWWWCGVCQWGLRGDPTACQTQKTHEICLGPAHTVTRTQDAIERERKRELLLTVLDRHGGSVWAKWPPAWVRAAESLVTDRPFMPGAPRAGCVRGKHGTRCRPRIGQTSQGVRTHAL